MVRITNAMNVEVQVPIYIPLPQPFLVKPLALPQTLLFLTISTVVLIFALLALI